MIRIFTDNLFEQLARCDREMQACAQSACNQALTLAERDGAAMGVADWALTKDDVLAEIASSHRQAA